ncbi:MAG: Crp/Fnr family transcriptional regulator [Planctomycetaceae bacterium]|jgi:CRP-like cAMP-binding protein
MTPSTGHHATLQELRTLELSAAWPHAVLERLVPLATIRECRAGTVLFREGEAADSIAVVASGTVALELRFPGRGGVRLLTVGRGELLGWTALLGGGPATATAIAQTDVRLVAFAGGDLAALCDRDHEVGFQVMRRLAWAVSRRLTATRLQLLDLYSREPPNIPGIPTPGSGT